MSEMSGEVMNLNDDESQKKEMSCNVTEQKNDESKRNEEENNDVVKEEDYENLKKAIKLHIEKMLTRNGVIQKVHMKLLN